MAKTPEETAEWLHRITLDGYGDGFMEAADVIRNLQSKLSSALEERDRYKHLAETGTTYVDALAMRNERDALSLRLSSVTKELEIAYEREHDSHSRCVSLPQYEAAQSRLDATLKLLEDAYGSLDRRD